MCGQSALASGIEIPNGETWEARPAALRTRPGSPAAFAPTIQRRPGWAEALLLARDGLVGVGALFPADISGVHVDGLGGCAHVGHFRFKFASAGGLRAVLHAGHSRQRAVRVVTMLVTTGLRKLLPRQVAGISSVHSFAFWRKKLMTLILDSSLQVLHGLYASVYAPMWLRLLGVKIGRNAEVSTAEGMVPELLTLGDDSFIADGAMLGDEEQRGGWMILKPTRIGNRSFVGNGAYVPDGATVPDDVLIGVQTRAPATTERLNPARRGWARRRSYCRRAKQLMGFPESLTFRPSRWRRLGAGRRLKALRIVLPLALVIATGYLIVVLVMPLAAAQRLGYRKLSIALAVAGCLYGVASFLLVVALKWMLVGRYRPRAAPMWTPFVWISEAVTNLYESLAVPNFLDLLRGTPMLPWALRLLGARLGRGVYLNTTDLTEFDCVRIGDEAELNAWCGPQTHLFEDRVMKIGLVDIGAQTTVGARTTILYDTQVGDRVRLGPLTLVAKGERLPAGTRWEGSPAASKVEK